MIHRGNGKSQAGAASLNRIERTPLAREAPKPKHLREQVEEWIAEHPVASVAAAIALGAFVGWIIKRR